MKELTFGAMIKTGMNATPDLVMGLAFLATWIEPTALGSNMQKYFVTIMLLEFITIHSAAFMAFAIIAGNSKIKKILRVIGLGIFYSMFIWAFTVNDGELWPMYAFWLMILNRIFSVLFGESEGGSQQIMLMFNWGWGVFCYLIAIFFTSLVPLPAFGWTPEYVKGLTGSASGLWFDTPQSLMAAGFLYFTAVGIFELYSPKLASKVTMGSNKPLLG
ncbi:MAG: hypothetical protein ACOYNS_09815 [Bacteroidota bacterium]